MHPDDETFDRQAALEPGPERRLFGTLPPILTSAVACFVGAFGTVALVDSLWIGGGLLLVVAVLLAALSVREALVELRPRVERTARASGAFGKDVWRGTAAAAVALRKEAALRAALHRLRRRRREALLELGDAAYRRDQAGVRRLRSEVAAVDGETRAVSQRIEVLVRARRVGRDRRAEPPTRLMRDSG